MESFRGPLDLHHWNSLVNFEKFFQNSYSPEYLRMAAQLSAKSENYSCLFIYSGVIGNTQHNTVQIKISSEFTYVFIMNKCSKCLYSLEEHANNQD